MVLYCRILFYFLKYSPCGWSSNLCLKECGLSMSEKQHPNILSDHPTTAALLEANVLNALAGLDNSTHVRHVQRKYNDQSKLSALHLIGPGAMLHSLSMRRMVAACTYIYKLLCSNPTGPLRQLLPSSQAPRPAHVRPTRLSLVRLDMHNYQLETGLPVNSRESCRRASGADAGSVCWSWWSWPLTAPCSLRVLGLVEVKTQRAAAEDQASSAACTGRQARQQCGGWPYCVGVPQGQ